ncbi:hypothetical protein G6048_39070 [Streptomyces sp. YC419]|uniref:Uncharacterized protein n=1 Tax=Streptomyces ureilyticus TaxID=1775131 RepID=A0ABX0E0U4_9ACTN|nr:hypothetical protein [Streptomyces ureilyticus]NGO47832.1 hypothetical protein [Streptomyces ureilyticus]
MGEEGFRGSGAVGADEDVGAVPVPLWQAGALARWMTWSVPSSRQAAK